MNNNDAEDSTTDGQAVPSPSPPVIIKVGGKEREFRFCLPVKHIKTPADLKRFQTSETYATLKVCDPLQFMSCF